MPCRFHVVMQGIYIYTIIKMLAQRNKYCRRRFGRAPYYMNHIAWRLSTILLEPHCLAFEHHIACRFSLILLGVQMVLQTTVNRHKNIQNFKILCSIYHLPQKRTQLFLLRKSRLRPLILRDAGMTVTNMTVSGSLDAS